MYVKVNQDTEGNSEVITTAAAHVLSLNISKTAALETRLAHVLDYTQEVIDYQTIILS